MEPTTAAPPPHTPHEKPAYTHTPASVMDVVQAVKPAPPIEDTDTSKSAMPPKTLHKDPPKSKAKQPAVTKKPGNNASGVDMAIAATVTIVLGLAGLATYAFLKTQK